MIAVNIMIYENSIKRFFSMSVTCIFSTKCSLILNSLKNLMNSLEKYFFARIELFSFLKDYVIFFGKLTIIRILIKLSLSKTCSPLLVVSEMLM